MTSVNGTAAARLAARLRELREHEWDDANLTQAKLAAALSAEQGVASATLSSWENIKNPKPPPTARLSAYARFFATRRSLDGPEPHLLSLNDLDDPPPSANASTPASPRPNASAPRRKPVLSTRGVRGSMVLGASALAVEPFRVTKAESVKMLPPAVSEVSTVCSPETPGGRVNVTST